MDLPLLLASASANGWILLRFSRSDPYMHSLDKLLITISSLFYWIIKEKVQMIIL